MHMREKKKRSQIAMHVREKPKRWSQIQIVNWNPYINAALLISKAYATLLLLNPRYISVVFILIIVLVFIGALYLLVTPNGNSKCDEDNHNVGNKADDVGSSSKRFGNGDTGDNNKPLLATAELPCWLLCCMGHFNVDNLVVSQFLLFLTSTFSELALMMAKLPSEEVAMGFQIIRRASLVMVLVTAHTMAAELLGDDDVLFACAPELLTVLVWFSIHFGHYGSGSATISIESWHRYAVDMVTSQKAGIVFHGVAIAVIAWLVDSSDGSTESATDLLSRFTSVSVACSFFVLLPSLCVFVLRQWPAKATAAQSMELQGWPAKGTAQPSLELQGAIMLLSLCRNMVFLAASAYIVAMPLIHVLLRVCKRNEFWPTS